MNIITRIQQLTEDGKLMGEYKTVRQASDKTGISPATIYATLKGKTKTCGGYTWRKINKETKEGDIIYY